MNNTILFQHSICGPNNTGLDLSPLRKIGLLSDSRSFPLTENDHRLPMFGLHRDDLKPSMSRIEMRDAIARKWERYGGICSLAYIDDSITNNRGEGWTNQKVIWVIEDCRFLTGLPTGAYFLPHTWGPLKTAAQLQSLREANNERLDIIRACSLVFPDFYLHHDTIAGGSEAIDKSATDNAAEVSRALAAAQRPSLKVVPFTSWRIYGPPSVTCPAWAWCKQLRALLNLGYTAITPWSWVGGDTSQGSVKELNAALRAYAAEWTNPTPAQPPVTT